MIGERPYAPPPRPEPAPTIVVIDRQPTCWRCGRTLLDYAARPWRVTCRRCKAVNQR